MTPDLPIVKIVVTRWTPEQTDYWQESGGYGPIESACCYLSESAADQRARKEQRAADLQNRREAIVIRVLRVTHHPLQTQKSLAGVDVSQENLDARPRQGGHLP